MNKEIAYCTLHDNPSKCKWLKESETACNDCSYKCVIVSTQCMSISNEILDEKEYERRICKHPHFPELGCTLPEKKCTECGYFSPYKGKDIADNMIVEFANKDINEKLLKQVKDSTHVLNILLQRQKDRHRRL